MQNTYALYIVLSIFEKIFYFQLSFKYQQVLLNKIWFTLYLLQFNGATELILPNFMSKFLLALYNIVKIIFDLWKQEL